MPVEKMSHYGRILTLWASFSSQFGLI